MIRVICVAALALALLGGAHLPAHAQSQSQSQAKVARSEKLPNVPGKSVTAVVVTFPPGVKSPPHHHAGSVLVYVLSGEIRSENSATGPAKVYKAGETFFEPAGSTHLVSENASATEPASILAVFIADDGATLTTRDQ
jgi:quercetin dioxygenase-like cupin family protein